MPQPPLCDLLPPAYLSSLRRTEARVRFVEDKPEPTVSDTEADADGFSRPGLRRRPTGPSSDTRPASGTGDTEWELSDLRIKAEQAVEKLSQAIGGGGGDVGAEDIELRQQLSQLNIPTSTIHSSHGRLPRPTGQTQAQTQAQAQAQAQAGATQPDSPLSPTGSREGRRKSNLCAPYPPNLPLALLRLMESYVVELAEVPKEKAGWNEAKRERGLSLIKSLTRHLGDAERLSAS